jgi:hypothetical protein
MMAMMIEHRRRVRILTPVGIGVRVTARIPVRVVRIAIHRPSCTIRPVTSRHGVVIVVKRLRNVA